MERSCAEIEKFEI